MTGAPVSRKIFFLEVLGPLVGVQIFLLPLVIHVYREVKEQDLDSVYHVGMKVTMDFAAM